MPNDSLNPGMLQIKQANGLDFSTVLPILPLQAFPILPDSNPFSSPFMGRRPCLNRQRISRYSMLPFLNVWSRKIRSQSPFCALSSYNFCDP